jgi:hypothetical protein
LEDGWQPGLVGEDDRVRWDVVAVAV